jgi:hypothetical protein
MIWICLPYFYAVFNPYDMYFQIIAAVSLSPSVRPVANNGLQCFDVSVRFVPSLLNKNQPFLPSVPFLFINMNDV